MTLLTEVKSVTGSQVEDAGRSRVLALSSDWFVVFFTFVLIGYNSCDFGVMTHLKTVKQVLSK